MTTAKQGRANHDPGQFCRHGTAESETHAGYAFVALVAHNALGASSILYYLVAYTLMSLGAFTVLMVVARREGPLYAFGDYAGLGTTAHGFLASRAWMSILPMPCSSVRS